MAKAKKTVKAKAKAKPSKPAAKKAKTPAKKAVAPKKVAKKPTKATKPAVSKKSKAAPSKKAPAPKKEKAVKELKNKAKVVPSEKPLAKKDVKPTKTKKANEVELLDEDFSEEVVVEEVNLEADPDDVVLTDADGNPYCKAKDCDQLSAVDGYCRYHYILLWKRIQNRKKILAGGKLDRYIEELTARYPDKYLEMLRKDLASEKDFLAVVAELDIDEGLNEAEFDDDSENFIDEMRGVSREEGDEEF